MSHISGAFGGANSAKGCFTEGSTESTLISLVFLSTQVSISRLPKGALHGGTRKAKIEVVARSGSYTDDRQRILYPIGLVGERKLYTEADLRGLSHKRAFIFAYSDVFVAAGEVPK